MGRLFLLKKIPPISFFVWVTVLYRWVCFLGVGVDVGGGGCGGEWVILQVGQNVTGNSRVVVDDLALGKATFRAHPLVEIGEANVSTRHPYPPLLFLSRFSTLQ